MARASIKNGAQNLIHNYSSTWSALVKYDKNEFPSYGTLEEIQLSAKQLAKDVQVLKEELINRGEATTLFAQEKRKGSLEGIFGNIFQTVFGEDAYP